MEGTTFLFSTGPLFVAAFDYYRMMVRFQGQTVNIGTSRTDPPVGSVGAWLFENVTKTNVMSFMGAVLVDEGFVKKAGGPDITFKPDCADKFLEGIALEPLFHSEISSSFLVYDILYRDQEIAVLLWRG